MSKDTVTFMQEMEFNVPTVPNFILASHGGEADKKPLTYFTEMELRKLGAAWTEQLIRRAGEQANETTPRKGH